MRKVVRNHCNMHFSASSIDMFSRACKLQRSNDFHVGFVWIENDSLSIVCFPRIYVSAIMAKSEELLSSLSNQCEIFVAVLVKLDCLLSIHFFSIIFNDIARSNFRSIIKLQRKGSRRLLTLNFFICFDDDNGFSFFAGKL